MHTLVYFGDALAQYGFGAGHPFGPDRLGAFGAELTRQGLDQRVTLCAPVACSDTDLLTFHTPAYVARVQQQSETGAGYLDYGDTPAFKGVYEAACAVVGTTLAAGAAVLAGGVRAFVPIGGLHHGQRDSAAGFCVFNDIGVLIEVLRARHGVRRIAYVDIDAHHGDGVYYAFESDPDLCFADMHEDGRHLYPGTGAASETGTGAGHGTKLNVPLPPGADDTVFMREWPRLEAFVRAAQPEIILLQAGADSIAGDPLTHLRLTPAAHAHATARLCAVADACCDGRLLALGGGGYNRENIAHAWTGVVRALLD